MPFVPLLSPARRASRVPSATASQVRARASVAAMVRAGLMPNVALAAGGGLIAALIASPAAAVWFFAGIAVVSLFFAMGILGLGIVLRGADAMALAGAGAVYLLQLYVAFALFAALRSAPAVSVSAVGIGALASAVLWQAGLVVNHVRTRRPVFDEPATTSTQGGQA